VRGRNHFVEAGVQLNLCRLPAKQQRTDQTQHNNYKPIVKQKPFRLVAGTGIEILQTLDNGLLI
jgi:hypothetical protein